MGSALPAFPVVLLRMATNAIAFVWRSGGEGCATFFQLPNLGTLEPDNG